MEILSFLRSHSKIDPTLSLQEVVQTLPNEILIKLYQRFFPSTQSEFCSRYGIHLASFSKLLKGADFFKGQEAIRHFLLNRIKEEFLTTQIFGHLFRPQSGEVRKIGFSKDVNLYFLMSGDSFLLYQKEPIFPFLFELFDWKERSYPHLEVSYDPILWTELARKASPILFEKREMLQMLEIYFDPSHLGCLDIVTSVGNEHFFLDARKGMKIPLQNLNLVKSTFKFNNFIFNFDIWLPIEELPVLNRLGTYRYLYDGSKIPTQYNEFLYLETSELLLEEGTSYLGKFLDNGHETYNSFLFIGSNQFLDCLFFSSESAKRKRGSIRNALRYTNRAKINQITPDKVTQACLAFFKVWNSGVVPSFLTTWMSKYPRLNELYPALSNSLEFIQAQESSSSPLLRSSPTFLSGRSVSTMAHLFNELKYNPVEIGSSEVKIVTSLSSEKNSFSTNLLGYYEDLYLPVVLYRKSLTFDPVFDSEPKELSLSRDLCYYWEPESQFLLYTPYVRFYRNRIHAYYEMSRMKNERFFSDPILDPYLEKISEQLQIEAHEWLRFQNLAEIEMGEFSSWLRPLKGRDFDLEAQELDLHLQQLGMSLGFSCLVFTHSVESGRVSTQILDLRTRDESFSSIMLR